MDYISDVALKAVVDRAIVGDLLWCTAAGNGDIYGVRHSRVIVRSWVRVPIEREIVCFVYGYNDVVAVAPVSNSYGVDNYRVLLADPDFVGKVYYWIMQCFHRWCGQYNTKFERDLLYARAPEFFDLSY